MGLMIDQPDLSRQNLVQQMSKSIDKAKVRMPCIEYKDDMEAEKSFFAKAETAAKQEKCPAPSVTLPFLHLRNPSIGSLVLRRLGKIRFLVHLRTIRFSLSLCR